VGLALVAVGVGLGVHHQSADEHHSPYLPTLSLYVTAGPRVAVVGVVAAVVLGSDRWLEPDFSYRSDLLSESHDRNHFVSASVPSA